MSVTRQGLLGVVTITWASIGNGSITPASGTLQMRPGDSMATFSLTVSSAYFIPSVSNSLSPPPQATSAKPYGLSEVFAVQLSAVTQSNLLFPAGVDPARAQSIIEPRGVVQILPQNYTSVEGQLVCMCVCGVYVCMWCVCVYLCMWCVCALH